MNQVVKKIEEAADFIRSRVRTKPKFGVILGSGLGAFANELEVEAKLPFSDIPYFEKTAVEGHSGFLVVGKLGNTPIVSLQGRVHYYEGHSMETVVLPTRVMALLGIDTLMITNSAGSLDLKMRPGNVMILKDHINLMGINPLMGENLKNLGPRFPDMTEAYDKNLIQIMERELAKVNLKYFTGVYCGVSGPTYETPAEVRYLQTIGGQAVGMSTVPESIAANHLGLRVCALSCITNLAAGLSDQKLSHDEVTRTAKQVENKFITFMKSFILELYK
ncbi:MAG: purine-nucleoside phosphorylase [Proteobacteria bacterium SG_bin7]|nr:MAG: purine-nucleoside phosphorylase [Proteobacteria bacterium SG_bin7]